MDAVARRGLRRGAAGGDVRRPRHARHRPPRPGDVPRAAAPAPRGRRRHRRTPTWSPYTSPTTTRPARARRGWRPGAPGSSTTAPRCGARPAAAPPVGRDPGARRRPLGQVERGRAAARGRGVGDLRGDRPTPPTTTTSGPSGCGCTGPAARRTGRRWRPSTWCRCWRAAGEPLLVDCLTLWLTRVLDRHDAWDDAAWAATGREGRGRDEVDALVEAWRTTGRRVVAVTNEVGQGVVPDTACRPAVPRPDGPAERRASPRVTEDVLWCTAGRVTRL